MTALTDLVVIDIPAARAKLMSLVDMVRGVVAAAVVMVGTVAMEECLDGSVTICLFKADRRLSLLVGCVHTVVAATEELLNHLSPGRR
jgi:hypothetical protein